MIALLERGISPAEFILNGFEATWLHDQNMADANVIGNILTGLNLPANELLADAQRPDIAEIHERYTQEAVADGAFGAPFMILNGEPFWGQDRLDFLEEALEGMSSV